MDLRTLADNFGILVDAPDGIEKLRSLVLELAVRGQLLPQLTSENLATVTLSSSETPLKRKENKASLATRKTSAKLSSEDYLFEIPSSWMWVTIGSIAHDVGQKKPDKPFTYIDVSSIDNTLGTIHAELSIIEPKDAPSRARKLVEMGSVIYSTVRPYLLNIAIIDRELLPSPIVSTAFAVLHPTKHVFNRYLFWYLRSPSFVRCVEQKMKGMAYPAISDSEFKPCPFPLPPLGEQRRIVAKVDHLMALCDELEQKKEKVSKTRIKLNTVSLDRLVSSQNPEEFEENWGRVRDGFPILITECSDLENLRQSIRILAVTGALSESKPFKEDAFTLLRRISEEHGTDLQGFPPAQSSHVPPCLLPDSWTWARFDQVAIIASNLVDPSGFRKLPHVAPDSIEKHTGRLLSYNTVGEDGVTSSKHKFYSGQILYSKIRPNLGKAVLIEFDGLCSADMYPINAFIDKQYLLLFILSSVFLKMAVHKDTRVAMPKINQMELNQILVSVPPLEEQEALVKKVKSLFAICDQMEAILRNRLNLSAKLANVLSRLSEFTELESRKSREGLLPASSTDSVQSATSSKQMVAAL